MKNRNSLIVGGLMALTLGLGVSGTAFAANDISSLSRKSSGYNQQFENQMVKVMTDLDYEGWKSLVLNQTGKVDPLITKDNFPKFAEAWKLAREGKIKEANILRKEIGLKSLKETKTATLTRHNKMNHKPILNKTIKK